MFGLFKRKNKKKVEVKEAPKPVKKEQNVLVEEEKSVSSEPQKTEEKIEEKDAQKPAKKRKAVMHITKHKDGGWQVKKEGAQRALRKFDTQKQAIDFAKEIEKEKGTGYIIHKADGKARKKRY